jgi:hypothetical protein
MFSFVVVAVSAFSALASRPPDPLIVRSHGLRVYGPPNRPNVCPRLSVLPPYALLRAQQAVTLAMPPFAARLKANGRDPIVRTVPSRRAFGPIAGGCGRGTWQRSVVAFVRLPHVCCASLSQHSFAVGRLRSGSWVLWAQLANVGP